MTCKDFYRLAEVELAREEVF